MSADDKISEALARVEHKLDIVLDMLGLNNQQVRGLVINSVRQVGDPSHRCSLCQQPVEYVADPIDSVIIRKCGCKTGKIALDLKAFAPPATPVPTKESSNGEDQEDRSNPRPRVKPGRR